MDHHGSERKNSDLHALRHDSARAHPSNVISPFNSQYALLQKARIKGKTKILNKLAVENRNRRQIDK